MHQLPTNDPRFAEYMADLRARRDEGRDLGTLPPYPVFVDRLFKQMATVDLHVVIELVERLSAPTDDKPVTLDPELLIRMLRGLETPHGSAMHAAVGCAGEGGELLDCVKKVFIYGKDWNAVDKKTGQTALENLLEEMGDFRFYYQKLLNMLGITDEDVQAHNYAKLSARYASGTYTDAQALERADKAQEPQFIGHKVAGLPPAPDIPRNFIGKPDPGVRRRKDDIEGGAK